MYYIILYILIIHFILHNIYACLYQSTYALHTHVYVYIYIYIGTQYIIHPSIRFIACVSRQPTRFAPWNPCWDIRCLVILTFPQQNWVETWRTWRQSTVENGFYGFIYQQKMSIWTLKHDDLMGFNGLSTMAGWKIPALSGGFSG